MKCLTKCVNKSQHDFVFVLNFLVVVTNADVSPSLLSICFVSIMDRV